MAPSAPITEPAMMPLLLTLGAFGVSDMLAVAAAAASVVDEEDVLEVLDEDEDDDDDDVVEEIDEDEILGADEELDETLFISADQVDAEGNGTAVVKAIAVFTTSSTEPGLIPLNVVATLTAWLDAPQPYWTYPSG